MPTPAAGSADSAIVHRIRQAAQVGDPGRSQRIDDRQHIGRERIGLAGQRPMPRNGRFSRVAAIAQLGALNLPRRQRRLGALRYQPPLLLR